MTALALTTAWAQVRHAPGRFASTVVAVALGVALAASVLLVGEEIPRAVESSVRAVVGHADLRVVARSTAGLDEELLPRIAAVPGVAVAAPVVSVPSFFDDAGAEQVMVWGIDLLNESALELYDMEAGQEVDLGDPLLFTSQIDSVIAPAELVEQRDLRKGDAMRLVTPNGVRSVTVRGVLGERGAGTASGVLVMDVYSAQVLFGLQGRFSHVDVLLADGADLEAVAERIAAEVGDAAHVAAAGTRGAAVQSMLAGAQLILRALSSSGILLAILLTFNRLAAVFAARRREVGVSRALGASPWITTVELLKEALLVGLLGAAIGTAAACFLATTVAPLMVRVAESVTGAPVPPLAVPLRADLLAIGAALGVGGTLAGALVPAWRAARLPVAAVLSGRGEVAADGEVGRSSEGIRTAAALLAAAMVLLWVETRTHGAVAGFVAMFLLVLVAGLAARPALELGLRLASRALSARLSPIDRLCARDLGRTARKASGAVRLVAIGLGIVVWSEMLVVSLEWSTSRLIGASRRADLIVASAYDVGSEMALLGEEILDELRRVPGVRVVGADRALFGAEFGLTAFDPVQFRDPDLNAWVSGEGLTPEALDRVAAGRAMLVSTGFAAHRGVAVGDEVTLPTPTGPLRRPVAGIADASTYSNKGDVVIDRDTYRKFWKDHSITRAHLALEAGASREDVRRRILGTLGAEHRLRVLTTAELADYYRAVVRRAAVLVQPMSLLALVVVVLGIGDTLLAGVIERRRELGTMRALGAAPGGVARFVVVQAAIVAAVGALLAVPLALGLGFALLDVTSIAVLGWPSTVELDAARGALVIGLGVAAALAGSTVPAWQAARITPADALRVD